MNGLLEVNTALRDWLRRPGPTSMPQAVSSVAVDREFDRPSDAPLPALVLENRFQHAFGGFTSAVAFAILILVILSGASAGAASTSNSVSAPVPLATGPARPAAGSDRSAVPAGTR